MSDQATLETALGRYVDPLLGRDLDGAGVARRVELDGSRARVHLELGFPAAGYRDVLAAQLHKHLAAACPGLAIEVAVEWNIAPHAVQKGLQPLPGVKNVIAVASGKGGVGKSTVAVNFALALQAEGARVGILDADLYGPSQPLMLGSRERPSSPDGRRMHPIIAHGLQAMSIGFLLDSEAQPTI